MSQARNKPEIFVNFRPKLKLDPKNPARLSTQHLNLFDLFYTKTKLVSFDKYYPEHS